MHSNTCKLSVIIPVYNCEPFLDRCIDSLLSQTLREWVAIFVNDGSTDRSKEILDRYAASDTRITVIDKENGGAASARNLGLKMVTTEYVTMLDADDVIESTMLEKMLVAACSSNCDLVVVPSNVQQSNGRYIEQRYEYCGLIKNNPKFLFRNVYRGPVAKLYRRDIIERYKLRMPEDMVMAEDYVFVVSYWTRSQSVYAIPECLYQYEYSDNPNSLIHRFCRKELPFTVYQKNAEAAWRVYQFLISVEANKSEIRKWTYELYRDFWKMGLNSMRHLDSVEEKETLKSHMTHLDIDFAQHLSLLSRFMMPHRYPWVSSVLLRFNQIFSKVKQKIRKSFKR